MLAFDRELIALGISPEVRLGTVNYVLQELAFATVAALACCEEDYRKRFERVAEATRARALQLAHDTGYYNKVASALGVQPVTSCAPSTTAKPVIN